MSATESKSKGNFFVKYWSFFFLITIFLCKFCNGLTFYVLSGAVYCFEELENKSAILNLTNLPKFVDDPVIRSNLFGAYTWLAPFLILPTLLLCEFGGAEMTFLFSRLIQAVLDFLLPYCKFLKRGKSKVRICAKIFREYQNFVGTQFAQKFS